jgi:hypothetical protein
MKRFFLTPHWANGSDICFVPRADLVYDVYNVSAAGKHLWDQPGTLILTMSADMMGASLGHHSTARVRRRCDMMNTTTGRSGSPMYVSQARSRCHRRNHGPNQRATQDHTLGIIHKVLGSSNSILLFTGRCAANPRNYRPLSVGCVRHSAG